MMPPQLQRGLWLKKHLRRTEQRPLAECLPSINVNDLKIPRDHKTYTAPYVSFRYPFISAVRISAFVVEFYHSERVQAFDFNWIRTGFGYPRATFICECGRPVTKLYFRRANVACRRCSNATYASRACSKTQRPALQAKRLQAFLEFKSYMSRRNRQRIKARIPKAPSQDLNSKRLAHPAIRLPQGNYGTRGAMHWR